MDNHTLQIEIFSDVVCPWCFIGKRRLDNALASIVSTAADAGETAMPTQLRWRPYQLHPQMPAQGMDRDVYLERRFGADADRGHIPERIRSEAQAEGIELRFDLMEKTPNTFMAHRLLEFAHADGLQHDLSEALFNAYFCQGVDVGDLHSLLSVAEQVGLDVVAVQEYLGSDDGVREVREQLERATDIGVSGVPGYYLANGFLLPGAQTSETMQQIISRVQQKIVAKAAG